MRKIIICIFFVLAFICSCSEKNVTAHYWLDKAKANDTDPKKAIDYLNKAIQLQQNYADAYIIRGKIYFKLNQYQHAVEDFNETIRLQPDDFEAYKNRGISNFKLKQYQHAIEDLDKAISLQPHDADTFKCRGYLYFEQGNKNLGCVDAKKSCDLGDCQLLKVAKGKGQCS